MTPSELKYHIEQREPESHFFDRKTMRFFGDSMRNYGVRRAIIRAHFDAAGNYHKDGVNRAVFELYRRHAVKHGLKASAFFDADTFAQVFQAI